jgi:hypothetical protein
MTACGGHYTYTYTQTHSPDPTTLPFTVRHCLHGAINFPLCQRLLSSNEIFKMQKKTPSQLAIFVTPTIDRDSDLKNLKKKERKAYIYICSSSMGRYLKELNEPHSNGNASLLSIFIYTKVHPTIMSMEL